MAHRVCPWWLGYFLASPLRRLMLEPEKVVLPFVHEGMTVLEPGPGMGFFTVELARLVGPSGRVVDIQPKMLTGLKRRVDKAALLNRVEARLVSPGSLGVTDLKGRVDFTLAFAVVHELPDAGRFFTEVAQPSKPGATLLLVETCGPRQKDRIPGRTGGCGPSRLLFGRPSVRSPEPSCAIEEGFIVPNLRDASFTTVPGAADTECAL